MEMKQKAMNVFIHVVLIMDGIDSIQNCYGIYTD